MAIVLLVGSATYINSITTYNSITSEPVVTEPQVYQDPELLAKFKYRGAEYTDKINLIYIDSISIVPNLDLPNEELYSGLNQHNALEDTIYIKIGLDPAYENITIAHEYLHYIWYTYLSNTEKETILEQAKQIAENDWYIARRISYRTNNESSTENELFPMICTERADRFITSMLYVCNKYIDRSKLLLNNN